jgi:Domain of unknown function (DUF1841)
MYTDDRNAYRKMFFDVWQKHQKKLPLETVEIQVLEIILAHPEYHALLDHPETFMNQDFPVEENPFLHMSLHIALREQLQLDRPAGIKAIYQELLQKHQPAHAAEHYMTTVLAQVLHDAQSSGTPPDENIYLEMLRKLIRG